MTDTEESTSVPNTERVAPEDTFNPTPAGMTTPWAEMLEFCVTLMTDVGRKIMLPDALAVPLLASVPPFSVRFAT